MSDRAVPLLWIAAQEARRGISGRDRFHRHRRSQLPGCHGVQDAAAGQRIDLAGGVAHHQQPVFHDLRRAGRHRHIACHQSHRVAFFQEWLNSMKRVR